MAITFYGPAFQRVHLKVGLVTLLTRSYNPSVQARWFGLFRFRSPLLSESRLIYFPPGTEMVHFPGLARTRLCIQRAVTRVHRVGFPHSDISGSKPACGSPKLFAACHVLHRLLAPRHPPYALSSLTIKLTPHVFASHDGKNAELVRRHSHCSTRANLRLHSALYIGAMCLPAYSVVKELCLRAWRSVRHPELSALADNKKPGVERRVPPSHDDGETRCSTAFYPVFVLNLTPYVFLRSPMAGLQTPLRRNCLQPIREYRDESAKRQAPHKQIFRDAVQIQDLL